MDPYHLLGISTRYYTLSSAMDLYHLLEDKNASRRRQKQLDLPVLEVRSSQAATATARAAERRFTQEQVELTVIRIDCHKNWLLESGG
jgi:hypothetical protein